MANVHRVRDRKQPSNDRFELPKDTQIIYANGKPKYYLINNKIVSPDDIRLRRYQQCQS